MHPYFAILRPGNCAMTAAAVFIGGLLVFGWSASESNLVSILTAMGAAFLIAGGGNVVNDIADLAADKVNRPKRPLPSGRISVNTAETYAIMLFLLGLLLASSINWLAFLIAIINTIMLIVYSTTLQHKVYIGNVGISYLVASSFVFGGAAMGKIELTLILAGMAFFSNLAREIVKDLEDLKGDRISFLRRVKAKLARKLSAIAERFNIKDGKPKLSYNPRIAVLIALMSLVLSITISPMPYFFGILKLPYLIFLVPADIVMILSIVQLVNSRSKKTLTSTSKLIKLGMILGLVSFVAGVLL